MQPFPVCRSEEVSSRNMVEKKLKVSTFWSAFSFVEKCSSRRRERQGEVKLTADCKIQWEVELTKGRWNTAGEESEQGHWTEQKACCLSRGLPPQSPDALRAGSQPCCEGHSCLDPIPQFRSSSWHCAWQRPVPSSQQERLQVTHCSPPWVRKEAKSWTWYEKMTDKKTIAPRYSKDARVWGFNQKQRHRWTS